MTILDASIKIYEWFASNDSFSVGKDSSILLGKPSVSKEESAAISCALIELKEMGLISTPSDEGSKVWVLRKNLANFEQTIKLTPEICVSLAQVINGFCKVIKNETELADPKNITDKEIKTLIGICVTLIDLQVKNENK